MDEVEPQVTLAGSRKNAVPIKEKDRLLVGKFGLFQVGFVFPVWRLICWSFLLPLGRLRVRGRYRVPRKGGLLILANHRSDCDPAVVLVATPRNIHFMAKSELFDIPVLGRTMRWAQSFPVKRGEPDRAALRTAAELIKDGECVCVFPEGQLTETGMLQTVKPGVALIIRLTQCPVLCIGLQNTESMMPYGKTMPGFSSKRLEATWGEPRQFEAKTSTEEILGWVEGQLRELSGEFEG